MKPLRIKKRESAGTPAEDEALTGLTSSASSVAAGSLAPRHVPSPPAVKGGRLPAHPGHDSGPSPAAATPAPTAKVSAAVKFSSELDNAAVEAYLEYLTHPHMSWESASRHVAHCREVIEEHRNSIYARSLAMLRRSSFASTIGSEGGDLDALETSTTSSVASAPAGFPRTAPNGSNKATGTLRKGRLGDAGSPLLPSDAAEPLAIVAHSSAAVSSSHSADSASCTSTGTGQRAPSNKGRLLRGPALAGPPRPHRTSSSATAPAAVGESVLGVGGAKLLGGSGSVFLVNGRSSAVTSRTASRDSTDRLPPVAPQGGGESLIHCKRTGGARAAVPSPQPKHRLK